MAKILILLASLALLQLSSGLECYQCPNVVQPCLVKDASTISCPGGQLSRCGLTIKKGATSELAVRKCVLSDTKTINCPPDSECKSCDSPNCNNADAVRFSQFALLAVVVALLAPKLIL